MKLRKKKAPPPHLTVGVFLACNPGKVYTYKVRRGHKLVRGDEVVADTPRGPVVGYVVRLDAEPQDTDPTITYKFIERRSVLI